MFVVFKFIVEDFTYGQYCIPSENMGMSLFFCTIQWVHSEYNNLYCIVNGYACHYFSQTLTYTHTQHLHAHTQHTQHTHNTHTQHTHNTHTTHTQHTHNTHNTHNTHTTHTQHTHNTHTTHTQHVTVTVVVGCVFLILAMVGKYTSISNRYACKRYSSTWISHDHQIQIYIALYEQHLPFLGCQI